MCQHQNNKKRDVKVGNLNESQKRNWSDRSSRRYDGNVENRRPDGRNGSGTETNKH